MKGFVGDGHDRVFYIDAVEGLYERCRIHGRQMAYFQATAVAQDAAMIRVKEGGEKEVQHWLEKVVARISAWEYFDGNAWKPFDDDQGVRLPVNDKSLGQLAPGLGGRIRGIIAGEQLADPDPETSEAAPAASESAKNSEAGSGSS